MQVAVQMDPIETINIIGDSTFALMLEAQRRGHRLFYYQPAAPRCRAPRQAKRGLGRLVSPPQGLSHHRPPRPHAAWRD